MKYTIWMQKGYKYRAIPLSRPVPRFIGENDMPDAPIKYRKEYAGDNSVFIERYPVDIEIPRRIMMKMKIDAYLASHGFIYRRNTTLMDFVIEYAKQSKQISTP